MSFSNPSFDVFGSFFPSWMMCAVLGVASTAAIRYVLVKVGLDEGVWPKVVVYPALATLVACVVWLRYFA